jgi:UTP--glucose-1-phosphate uridylyltransferase
MPCCLQVAERTVADKKGGHLTKRKSDGRLLLRESAMVSDEDKPAFEDTTKCAASCLIPRM